MVQTDVSQLSHECNGWRENLRTYRQEFTEFRHRLQDAAGHSLPKDIYPDVEHYHNQFHIQLINIHDLKQSIKQHDRKVSFETSSTQVSDETLANHENLYDRYIMLEQTLHDLRSDFNQFLSRLN